MPKLLSNQSVWVQVGKRSQKKMSMTLCGLQIHHQTMFYVAALLLVPN